MPMSINVAAAAVVCPDGNERPSPGPNVYYGVKPSKLPASTSCLNLNLPQISFNSFVGQGVSKDTRMKNTARI